MSFIDQITVLVLTFNEAPNIGRVLGALSRFPEIVVLDSGSTDETPNIVSQYPNAHLVVRSFDQHARQWNYGLKTCSTKRPWVLALDADYLVPGGLIDEIAVLQPTDSDSGYRISFRYCIHGRPLSGSLYPSHVVLYRCDRGHYVQEGHTQRILVNGQVRRLRASIDHDDRKPLSRWLASQHVYARMEAEHLLNTPRGKLRFVDRIRLTAWLSLPAVFLSTLFGKGCILDGWPGWLYVLQRTLAETLIAAELVHHSLRQTPSVASCAADSDPE